jgi:peptide/nickel transport system ATP-binding protein
MQEPAARRRTMHDAPLLVVSDLKKTFSHKRRFRKNGGGAHGSDVYALDGVSFSLGRGETLGIIGESGCGKSTTARILVGLVKPDSGVLRFEDADVLRMGTAGLQTYRKQVQIVFQDPYEYLNPRMTLRDIVCEPLVINRMVRSEKEKDGAAEKYLEQVGLAPAKDFSRRFTHELSGGQRQRVAVARSLVLHPKLLIADEPTSMLDVSVRAGILNLLKGLAIEYRMSMVFITHDIATSGYMCDRLAVMYKGRIVEIGDRDDIIKAPRHPYTKALVQVCRDLQGFIRERGSFIKEGEVDAFERGGYCCFSGRCVCMDSVCGCGDEGAQELTEVGTRHLVACAQCR